MSLFYKNCLFIEIQVKYYKNMNTREETNFSLGLVTKLITVNDQLEIFCSKLNNHFKNYLLSIKALGFREDKLTKMTYNRLIAASGGFWLDYS